MSLSLETGVHRNYISAIERAKGNPSVKKIAILADELEMALDDLFCRAAELLPGH